MYILFYFFFNINNKEYMLHIIYTVHKHIYHVFIFFMIPTNEIYTFHKRRRGNVP